MVRGGWRVEVDVLAVQYEGITGVDVPFQHDGLPCLCGGNGVVGDEWAADVIGDPVDVGCAVADGRVGVGRAIKDTEVIGTDGGT